MKESRYGWFPEESRERDYHQHFQLSTRNLFWRLQTWVVAARSGLEIALEVASFPSSQHILQPQKGQLLARPPDITRETPAPQGR